MATKTLKTMKNQNFRRINNATQTYFQELEKRFSETGAYKNLKKMLASKNDTIKELRKKISTYEPSNDEIKEED